jgi:DNA-binding LacI/PurR family transcriptional regulator
MATIKDVAEAAGVSTATVSYVLNRTKQVGPDVEQRVIAAAKALHYQPNATARNLRLSENRIIGYELPVPVEGDMAPLMHQFAYQLSQTAAQAGYNLITFAHKPGESELEGYKYLIRTQRVDGFVLPYTNWYDPRIELLIEENEPFVAFGRANPELDFPFVDVDGYDGIRQVVLHLLEQGHTRLGFIGWPEGSVSGDARHDGYCETLRDAGIEIFDQYDCRGNNIVNNGYMAASVVMACRPYPTALVCVSDILAIGAMRYLTENGFQVGRDVAVAGFDDIPLADYLTPSLTSVRQPLELVGKQLMNILIARIRGVDLPEDEQHVLLSPSLVIRESTHRY